MLDHNMGDGLRGFAKPHVICQESSQSVGAQMLQPSDAVLLIRPQNGVEVWRDSHRDDFGIAAEPLRVGLNRGGILPPRGQKVLKVQHACGFGVRQQQPAICGATGGINEVGHHGEEAPNAFRRQFQDAAIIEAGDEFAIDNLRCGDTAAIKQAGEDR